MSEHHDRPATHPDPAWLAAWRRDIEAATATVLAGFEERFGYPPGRNTIDTPGPHDLAAAARLVEHPVTTPTLAHFYRHIGRVVLEDIGNAYFIHPATHVLRDLTECGPIPLGQPGPGALFASDGTVYRSAVASRDSAFHRPAAARFVVSQRGLQATRSDSQTYDRRELPARRPLRARRPNDEGAGPSGLQTLCVRRTQV